MGRIRLCKAKTRISDYGLNVKIGGNNLRKNEKGITLLQLLIIGIALIMILVCWSVIKKSSEKENVENNIISIAESAKLNVWNGVYTKGNYTITLIRTGPTQIEITMTKYNNGVTVDSRQIELNSDSKLIYDTKEKIELEKTANGFKFTAPESSSLTEFTGDYEWHEFSKLSWDGIYTNGNYTIVLAEIEEQRLNITITSKLESWDAEITQFTSNEITYNESLLGASQSLKIVKSANGIEVESSSDNKDSVLNKITGIFEKAK